ncbi:MAG: hypothetical protein Dbin4_03008 [Alphaproteobacteria bacterium]|nr:hypothetical protein [Alphaproteobacteria bacterium]
MARLKIIILEKHGDKLSVGLWADVPAARQPFYADSTKVSAWRDATADDNAALRSGAVAEKVAHIDLPGAENLAEVKPQLIAMWNSYQQKINDINPWKRYGTTWDGTAWANTGVA